MKVNSKYKEESKYIITIRVDRNEFWEISMLRSLEFKIRVIGNY